MILNELFYFGHGSDRIDTLVYLRMDIDCEGAYKTFFHLTRGQMTSLEVLTEWLEHCYQLPSTIYNEYPIDSNLHRESFIFKYKEDRNA